MKVIPLIISAFVLTSCNTTTNHLPLPHQMPGSLIGSKLENSGYQARRKRVMASIQPNVDFVVYKVADLLAIQVETWCGNKFNE